MINIRNAKQYCCEDISQIENYELAMSDNIQTWHCHHRAEVLPCGTFTQDDLKKHGLFFKVPASQLIFLTNSDHIRLHSKNISEGTRRKMSEAKSGENHPFFGKKMSDETRMKISEAQKGKVLSDETKRRISEVKIGHEVSEEARRKMSEAKRGKPKSEEHKRKMSEAHKRYWERRRAAI